MSDKRNLIERISIPILVILGILLLYSIMRASHAGHDANVYLYASQHIGTAVNIYDLNPYNKYLYSPLFAFLLKPISWNLTFGRIVWAIINSFAAARIFWLLKFRMTHLVTNNKSILSVWLILTALCSLSYITHNFNLGQINILILWMTMEAVIRVMDNKTISGSGILALGINIKIIPLLAGFYLLCKGKIKSSFFTGAIVVLSLAIPILFVGWSGNIELHKNWFNTINPSGEKYAIENDNGCHSLNALIPAFFYEFTAEKTPNTGIENTYFGYERIITKMSMKQVTTLLLISRLLAVLVLVLFILRNRKTNHPKMKMMWEIAALCLVTFLIFPHQKKYALIYILPAMAYMILYAVLVIQHWKSKQWNQKLLGIFVLMIWLYVSFTGRDIIGNYLVGLFDFYHVMGFIVLTLLVLLWIVPPEKIFKLNASQTS